MQLGTEFTVVAYSEITSIAQVNVAIALLYGTLDKFLVSRLPSKGAGVTNLAMSGTISSTLKERASEFGALSPRTGTLSARGPLHLLPNSKK